MLILLCEITIRKLKISWLKFDHLRNQLLPGAVTIITNKVYTSKTLVSMAWQIMPLNFFFQLEKHSITQRSKGIETKLNCKIHDIIIFVNGVYKRFMSSKKTAPQLLDRFISIPRSQHHHHSFHYVLQIPRMTFHQSHQKPFSTPPRPLPRLDR